MADFWSRLDKRPSGCWIWTGAKTRGGYGNVARNGRWYRAHRLAWELTHGAVARAQQVLHRCDVPACCNPEHLFLGSQLENMRDMHQKGRAAVGLALPQTKLSDARVTELRKAHAEGKQTQRQLAAQFGVTQSHVCAIVAGAKRVNRGPDPTNRVTVGAY